MCLCGTDKWLCSIGGTEWGAHYFQIVHISECRLSVLCCHMHEISTSHEMDIHSYGHVYTCSLLNHVLIHKLEFSLFLFRSTTQRGTITVVLCASSILASANCRLRAGSIMGNHSCFRCLSLRKQRSCNRDPLNLKMATAMQEPIKEPRTKSIMAATTVHVESLVAVVVDEALVV